MQNKTVDVIIPTFRPDRKFDILLQRLLSQNVRPRRIIVVNTGEEFWDEEHVRKVTGGQVPEVFHVRPEEFDHGGTRHLAIQRSDADVFVCMTQDAVPADKDLIGNLLRMLYSEDHVAAVCCRLRKAAADARLRHHRAVHQAVQLSGQKQDEVGKGPENHGHQDLFLLQCVRGLPPGYL